MVLPSSPSTVSVPLPQQRWEIAPAQADAARRVAAATNLSPLLAQVLVNRGITDEAAAQIFLQPELQVLPSPLEVFADLPLSLELLINAINQGDRIAICGDYDADGMTSTALLLRSLRTLGARVEYAIPSRMSEGYGLNERIVEDFYESGVALILTVDNGIAAHAPIARARQLGLAVIITDHHDLPPILPEANAILNPKQIPETSPYWGMAGVGVAYLLALSLAESLGRGPELAGSLLELFTLGTIADLAPLTGVNRRWVKQGLQQLPQSQLAGVQALIQVAGLSGAKDLKPEAIGFRLGPRINAVGRLADPQIVIELLTTDEPEIALELAMKCEQINQQRQNLCEVIEQEAIALCEHSGLDALGDRVLVVVQPGWHHGVIGIVASRLVERYGVPVFIGTYEDESGDSIRGSARSIPEFHVFEALQTCSDLLTKFGGHRAAGGFSLATEHLEMVRSRLRDYAYTCLEPEHLKPLVQIDAQATLAQVNHQLYAQIDLLHPCGVGNPAPVFWSANVEICEQKILAEKHLRLLVRDASLRPGEKLTAIAWRWANYFPLPQWVDLAYQIRTNEWNGEVTLQLEVVGLRLLTQPSVGPEIVEFCYGDRTYQCKRLDHPSGEELRIRNDRGNVLIVQRGQRYGVIRQTDGGTDQIDVAQPYYFNLIRTAISALNQSQHPDPDQ